MARAPSLKPQLNQIRTWIGEGVTDIWIAHQLDVTPAQIADFRRKQGLLRPDETPAPAKARAPRAAAAPRTAAAPRAAKPRTPRAPKAEPVATEPSAASAVEAPADAESATTEDGTAKRRRRGRRGGRGRGKARALTIPATLEHGPDGVVIRIDAAILESEAYREHWAGVASGGIAISATGITLGTAVDEAEERSDVDDAEAPVGDDADGTADED